MDIRPVPSIDGAFANDLGQIKLPEATARMPHGKMRVYKTKWVNGQIRSARKGAAHKYYGIFYRKKNYKIHRLVCEAFHGAPKAGQVVIHINEDGTDNRPSNLKWGTQKENLNAPGFIEYCKGRTGNDSPYVKGLIAKGLA